MIEGCTDAAKGDITIPDKINNMRVLKIAENADLVIAIIDNSKDLENS